MQALRNINELQQSNGVPLHGIMNSGFFQVPEKHWQMGKNKGRMTFNTICHWPCRPLGNPVWAFQKHVYQRFEPGWVIAHKFNHSKHLSL
jgi:hypothetical protein